jgi:hypothetical protein
MTATPSILVAVALAAGSAALAGADTIAYEGFAYGGSPNLAGANGGSGWGSAWFKLSSIPTGVILEGMNWPGVPAVGNSALTAPFASADYTRYSRSIAPYAAPQDVVYVSFLFRPNVGFGVGGGLAFGTWENGMVVGLVPGTGQYGLSGFQGPSSLTGHTAALSQTVFLVAKVRKNADGTISWSLFADPASTSQEPAVPEASMTIPGSALPQAVNLYNDGGFSTDEIRIATTWAAALGQPEPCLGDLDGDGVVSAADLAVLLSQWGGAGSADLNADRVVDGVDLTILLGAWGTCP